VIHNIPNYEEGLRLKAYFLLSVLSEEDSFSEPVLVSQRSEEDLTRNRGLWVQFPVAT
jgi:hypothetical protein